MQVAVASAEPDENNFRLIFYLGKKINSRKELIKISKIAF